MEEDGRQREREQESSNNLAIAVKSAFSVARDKLGGRER